MENKSELDSLIVKEGKELNENEQKLVESKDLFKNELAYDDGQLLPGQNIEMPNSESVALDKDAAHDNLIQTAAMLKLQKENEAFQKLSDDEKVKDYVCQAQYYKETNDFFKKYGYEMSGKQKRFTKRAIENAWKKGKFKVTPEQREDILFELNKASKQPLATQPSDIQQNNQSNISENIKDLNSLIFRQ